MNYVCYRKIAVFWLWMFAIVFVIGAWLVIMSSCNLADSEAESEEPLMLIDQDGWEPGTNPDAIYNRFIGTNEVELIPHC